MKKSKKLNKLIVLPIKTENLDVSPDYEKYRYPYVGGGEFCNYCGAKVFTRGVCSKAANHEDHGGF